MRTAAWSHITEKKGELVLRVWAVIRTIKWLSLGKERNFASFLIGDDLKFSYRVEGGVAWRLTFLWGGW